MPDVTQNQAKIFFRLAKVDEEKRLVYGRATEECIDRAGEVFDYDSSKPYFETWSAEVFKDSGGKSFGNLRAMHSSIAAGRLDAIEFLDDQKAIDISAHVVDDAEWKKVLAGVYTGFSVGGRYEKKWSSMFNKTKVNRFTASPAEISLVDRPCVPSAKFFDVMKADGSSYQKEFVAPTSATSGLAPYGSKGKKRKKPVKKLLDGLECVKGMGSVAYLARLIADLKAVYENAKGENVAEDNGASTVPTKLRDAVQVLSRVLAEMAVEESQELDDTKPELDYNWMPYRASDSPADLQKSLGSFLGLAKADSGFTPEQTATLQSVHDTAHAMGAACSHSNEDTAMAKADDNAPLTKADLSSVVATTVAEALAKALSKDDLGGEGSKRGTGVKMGVKGGQSDNAEESSEDGKMSPTHRASNKADDWSDEDMDKAAECDDDMAWESKKSKKMASKKSWDKWEEKRAAKKKAAKADSGEFLTKADLGEIIGATIAALVGDGGAPLHKSQAPALFAVAKEGEGVTKAQGNGTHEVEPITGAGGKVNEAATLMKAVHANGPVGFVSSRGFTN